MTHEGRERYGNEAVAGAAEISQNDDDFVNTAAEFDAARTNESAAMARLQQARGLTDHAAGTAAEREEGEKGESLAMERSQPARNLID